MGSLAAEDMYTESDLIDFVEPSVFSMQWQSSGGSSSGGSIFDSGLIKDWNAQNNCQEFSTSFNGFQSTPISVLDYAHPSDTDDSQSRGSSFDNYYNSNYSNNKSNSEQEGESMELQELLAGFSSSSQQQFQADQHLQSADNMMMMKVAELAGELEVEISSGDDLSYNSNERDANYESLLYHQQRQQQQQQGQNSHYPFAHSRKRLHSIEGEYNNIASSPYMVEQHQLQQRQQFQQQIKREPGTHNEQHFTQQQLLRPKVEDDHQEDQQLQVFQNRMKIESALASDPQMQLVQLLVTCAGAVSERNISVAHAALMRLQSMVVPEGSPMQRLACYMVEGLAARLHRDTASPLFEGLVCNRLQQLNNSKRSDMLEAFGAFYDYIPIGKFTHLTMNQILLEAVEREKMIHVVDFQVWYGAQWPCFLQALALRPQGPPMVRMTAVGSSLKDLQESGAKLLENARNLGVPFEYCILNIEIEQFHASYVELREGEAVVVNSLSQFHCILNGESGFAEQFLQGIKSIRPKVVVMAENDADHNNPAFIDRFMECLRYYAAVFDAIEASLPANLPGRMKLEQLIAAQKIRNIIACEGKERVERHEPRRAWNARMENVGFRAMSLSDKAVCQATLLLNMYFCDGYSLACEDGFLILCWRGVPLNGVAAWV